MIEQKIWCLLRLHGTAKSPMHTPWKNGDDGLPITLFPDPKPP
jgi:hypothetical protein